FAILSQVQFTTLTPSNSFGRLVGRSSLYPQTPLRGISSSLAHFISHNCPSAFLVFFVTITKTPSHPFILFLQFVFQAESHGFLTDISTNSNGEFSFLACPTKKSLKLLSSMAKLINTLFLDIKYIL